MRQHIDLITPSGRHYRWGEDEPLPENVFSDLRHSSTMPGGFETCDVTLPRKPGVDYSDLERLSTLRVIGAGGQVDGEYRLERAPRVSGDQMAISPSAVGWQAHLEDDKSAREIYVDRDLSHWQGPSNPRQVQLWGLSPAWTTQQGSTEVGSDIGGDAALQQVFTSANRTASLVPVIESWYGGGIRLGALYSSYTDRDVPAGAALTGANWAAKAQLMDVTTAIVDTTADLAGTAADGYLYATSSADKYFAVLQFWLETVSTGDGDWRTIWKKLAVYGNHGLTGRGEDPQGFYASDVVRHAVQTWAPLLQLKPDSIQQSGFVIPHLVFLEPTTAAEIIRQASRFNLPDWAVWEDKEFVWHERGARGKTWRARIGPSELEETGPQLDRLWESVMVSYQDVDGSTRTVGPPGSGADTESALLKDYDPENPANKLGIVRREVLQMGTSTAAGATEVGARFLEQTKLLDSSGRATITGWVEDDRGVVHPYSRVRAGDTISFVDASDSSPRRIVKVDHSRASRSCSVELDAPPQGLQELLERLSVVLLPLGA